VTGSCKHDAINGKKFLDQLCDYQLLKGSIFNPMVFKSHLIF
jgi:hypothetical protein